MTEPNGHDLIRRIAAGDVAAMESLLSQCQVKVRLHLVRMLRDEAAADDLCQDVFWKVWTQAGQWRGEGSVHGWIMRIATNLALNHIRSIRRRAETPLVMRSATDEDEEDIAPAWMVDQASLGPQAAVEQTEARERLRQFVDELDEDKREVVRLIYDEQLDVRAAADQLRIPEGTVKSRLYHARQRLADRWQEQGNEP